MSTPICLVDFNEIDDDGFLLSRTKANAGVGDVVGALDDDGNYCKATVRETIRIGVLLEPDWSSWSPGPDIIEERANEAPVTMRARFTHEPRRAYLPAADVVLQQLAELIQAARTVNSVPEASASAEVGRVTNAR